MPKIIENVNEKLILEGRKTLLEKSYRELNIRDVAANCDIGIGTFYNYFHNKEEFVAKIFRDDWGNTLNLADNLKSSTEPLKEKIRKIYLSMQGFVDRYLSIFYEIAMIKGYERNETESMKLIYTKVEEILSVEKAEGNIKSRLSAEKLSHFIVSNLMYLCESKYISFDELYDHMNI
ncbi:MAG: TetR/AcrR family transcriptional regulator [Bacillota bacterium]|nr:TetR/AcrR family transcriptional regulator [Bacillota bacterium]